MANLQELKINDIQYIDIIYPIGCIFQTTESSFDPNITFGGTWSRIKGKFLVGVNEDETEFDTVDKTGGEKSHTLTVNEIPSHGHSYAVNIQHGDGATTTSESLTSGLTVGGRRRYTDHTYGSGGGASHNNLPPYYAVYIWKREA